MLLTQLETETLVRPLNCLPSVSLIKVTTYEFVCRSRLETLEETMLGQNQHVTSKMHRKKHFYSILFKNKAKETTDNFTKRKT